MNISLPEISIILPFYNSENTLDRAIDSIVKQSCPYFECLLVDNNSTDNSLKIAQKYQQKDNRFKIIKEKKQGVVFAANTAEAHSRGKYVCRMDADDWMYPQRLKWQLEFLDKNRQYGVVSGLAEYVSDQPRREGFRRYMTWVNAIMSWQDISLQRFIESPIVNPTAMWRKELSGKYGMYKDGDFPEDYELWLRWLKNDVKMSKLDRPLIKWYDSASRLTRTDPRYGKKAFYKIKSIYLAEWLQQNNPFYPEIVVWGASRISRRRAEMLEKHTIKISAYIDISKKRKLDKDVIHYLDLPAADKMFIMIYVAHDIRRGEIREFLGNRGYREGINYLFAS